ncbi:MAG TPA: type II toxin-antitoxin system HicA family toxin [Atribacterota bacterium]|nr:type II toxin-antitoxin system HicA family toxin [Atribacterota bacterium]
MPKLPIIKSKEIIRVLHRIGFIPVRSRGSYLQLRKGNLLVTVPIKNKDLKYETLKSILRQAKIGIKDLERYL